jgi:hypothetical protein
MKSKPRRSLRIHNISKLVTNRALAALIGLCFFLVAVVAIRDQSPSNLLSLRYLFNSVPTALSFLLGRPHDYAAYREVANRFWEERSARAPLTVDKVIKEIMATPVRDPDQLWFYNGDDKGLADIVYVGFRLFGLHSKSIYYVQLLLLGLSTALAVLFCRSDTRFLLILLFYFLSLYAILFTFEISNESTSLTEPRFIGYLSVPSMLFFAFASLNREPLRVAYVLCSVAQAFVLLMIIHARSSEIWQMMAVFAVALMCSVSPIFNRDWKMLGQTVFPVLVLVIAYCGLAQYKSYMYNDQYFAIYHSSRIVWHNALMGVAFNDDLGPKYHLAKPNSAAIADDFQVITGVGHFIAQRGEMDVAQSLFSKKDTFNWILYERYARALYFKIVTNDFWQVARTYLEIMPSVLVDVMRFMATDNATSARHIIVYSPLETPKRHDRDLYLNPFRGPALLSLFVIALLIFLSRWSKVRLFLFSRRHICAFLLCTAFASIPPMLTVPYIQYAQLFILILLMWGYIVLTSFMYFFLGRHPLARARARASPKPFEAFAALALQRKRQSKAERPRPVARR